MRDSVQYQGMIIAFSSLIFTGVISFDSGRTVPAFRVVLLELTAIKSLPGIRVSSPWQL